MKLASSLPHAVLFIELLYRWRIDLQKSWVTLLTYRIAERAASTTTTEIELDPM
jgi:hypothetical protein